MGTSEIGPFSGGNTAIFQRVDGSQGPITSTPGTISFNTELQPKPWVSLSSDIFTLDPGVYVIEVRLIATNDSASDNTLNISAFDTDGTQIIGGEADRFIGNEDRKCISRFSLNLSSLTNFEINGRCTTSTFNIQSSGQSPNFNSQVYFTKIG